MAFIRTFMAEHSAELAQGRGEVQHLQLWGEHPRREPGKRVALQVQDHKVGHIGHGYLQGLEVVPPEVEGFKSPADTFAMPDGVWNCGDPVLPQHYRVQLVQLRDGHWDLRNGIVAEVEAGEEPQAHDPPVEPLQVDSIDPRQRRRQKTCQGGRRIPFP